MKNIPKIYIIGYEIYTIGYAGYTYFSDNKLIYKRLSEFSC